MTFRPLFAGLALATAATAAEAGPFRRHAPTGYQPYYYYQPGFQSYSHPVYQPSVAPPAVTPAGATTADPTPTATSPASGAAPAVTLTAATTVVVPDGDG